MAIDGGGSYVQNLDWLDLRLRKHLISQVRSRTLHHFVLFSSPSALDLAHVSRALALDWVQVPFQKTESLDSIRHPDVIIHRPQGKTGIYSVEGIRDIIQELSLKTFSGNGRAIILDLAEKLSLPAANAFLKVLEEPPQDTVFIMNATRLDRMIGTILSRCRVIRIPVPIDRRKSILQEFPSEFVDSIQSLFLNMKERATYEAIRKVGESVEEFLSQQKKLVLKEISAKVQNQSSVGVEELKVDLKESELFSWTIEQGEKVLNLIEYYWKERLIQMNGEISSLGGKKRFPDDSLLYFYSATRALELGFPLEEIVSQLLLALFGYITPAKPQFSI